MSMRLIIDGAFLVNVGDFMSDEELFELNGFPIVFVELSVWE